MAASAFWYGNAFVHAFQGDIDLGGTIKVALFPSTFTPDQDTQDAWDDISSSEVTGTGYTAGGATVSNAAITYTSATNVAKITCDAVTWSDSTISAQYAVFYVDTGTDSTSYLIGYQDAGETKSSSGGDFVFTPDSAGLFTVTPAAPS